MASGWTRGRWKLSRPGPNLPPSRNSSNSWDSLTSTVDSFKSTAPLPVHSPTCSITSLSLCPGPQQPRRPSRSWRKLSHQAPILVHPDPERPFIVEVDASTTGVGAILSQQQGNPVKLHPCAFFSRKLSPAERNYDIGKRGLLAIKLALEEWRHWLEGANILSQYWRITKTCNIWESQRG